MRFGIRSNHFRAHKERYWAVHWTGKRNGYWVALHNSNHKTIKFSVLKTGTNQSLPPENTALMVKKAALGNKRANDLQKISTFSKVWVCSPHWEDTLAKEMATHSSGSSDGKSVYLQCGRPRFHPWVGKIAWKRKWLPTPVLLPGKFQGWRSLVSYSPWDSKE